MDRFGDLENEEVDVLGWIISAGLWILVAAFVASIMFFSDLIPFQFFEFWGKKDILGGVYASWPIFVWGVGATFVLGLFFPSGIKDEERSYPWDILRSFFAGLLEETTYRWVFFFAAIVTVVVFDFITFGLGHWIYVHIGVPVVGFVTLGKVEWIFYWKDSWIVGAAALNTTSSFGKAHKYLGWLGVTNAWFLGWFFFYILVNYGIIAAIVSHALYDMVVFTTVRVQGAIAKA